MARRFARRCSPGKGEGLFAVNMLRAGELVFSAEPFACCVSKKQLKAACENCLSRKDSLLRCSQCKIARFCNRDCQRQAWPEHKRECKSLQRLHPITPTDSVRLVAKIIFRLLNEDQSPGQELYRLEEHESHMEDMSEEQRVGLEHLSSALKLYLKDEAVDLSCLPSGLTPVSLLARMTCNCFTISDGELKEVGVGLYPNMSLLNHDCRPNCVMLFEGRILHLRAIRDIQPNEELTISYIDTLMPSSERRKRLQEQYHFLCQCQQCATADRDSDMLCGAEEVWRSCRDSIPHVEELQAEADFEKVLKECQDLAGRCRDRVSDRNVYLLRVLDMALDACVNLGQWERALEYSARTLEPYRLYYPDPHPARAVQLARVGKLQHYLGRLAEARDTFKQAYDVIKVTHGNEHALTNEVKEWLVECQAEMDRS
ncbi:histone-lysine N-methyltransferase SMYD3 [Megalops cyprinoides]|uniref:histone-lysine N-methyltransferase SMYD3 n=1 Tax=Megalops cyprinoides TaxID=118141 RepID=UPI001864834A|nr:histone-lysine N-methyltransferase SMYD3 [Megalops cyprinoides]